MLIQLSVKNFVLIENLQIEFLNGLNIITGETGAGKSILIDALQLVLGERLDTSQIRNPELPATVQATFSLEELPELRQSEPFASYLSEDDDCLILKREMTSEGRSKNFVNQQMVNLSTLKDLGQCLVDVHGQYDHQRIFDPSSHLCFIDRFARDRQSAKSLEAEKAHYRNLYLEFAQLSEKKNQLIAQKQGREREIDLLTYQIREIERINPQEGEEYLLMEEKIRLAHAEKLHELAAHILEILDEGDHAVSGKICGSFREWSEWIKIDASMDDLKGEMESVQGSLEEIILKVRNYRDKLSFDPDRLKEIETRLDGIETIKRKYGGTVTTALTFLQKAKSQLDQLVNAEGYQQEADRAIAKIMPQLNTAAGVLTKHRKKAMQELAQKIERELKDLAIRNARFECRYAQKDFSENGRDEIEFMICPNPGEPLTPLAKTASGGEASRIMLAIKGVLSQADMIPTLIFDEIDANVGGRLGSIVGEKLKGISALRQVLLITHLPQIASFADRHFKVFKKVEKQKTSIHYEILEGPARVRELAQMMSGENETDISKAHAREMLAAAGSH